MKYSIGGELMKPNRTRVGKPKIPVRSWRISSWAGSESQGRKVNYRREGSETGNGKRDMNIEVSVYDSRTLPARFCRTSVFTPVCSNNGRVFLCFSLSLSLASVSIWDSNLLVMYSTNILLIFKSAYNSKYYLKNKKNGVLNSF